MNVLDGALDPERRSIRRSATRARCRSVTGTKPAPRPTSTGRPARPRTCGSRRSGDAGRGAGEVYVVEPMGDETLRRRAHRRVARDRARRPRGGLRPIGAAVGVARRPGRARASSSRTARPPCTGPVTGQPPRSLEESRNDPGERLSAFDDPPARSCASAPRSAASPPPDPSSPRVAPQPRRHPAPSPRRRRPRRRRRRRRPSRSPARHRPASSSSARSRTARLIPFKQTILPLFKTADRHHDRVPDRAVRLVLREGLPGRPVEGRPVRHLHHGRPLDPAVRRRGHPRGSRPARHRRRRRLRRAVHRPRLLAAAEGPAGQGLRDHDARADRAADDRRPADADLPQRRLHDARRRPGTSSSPQGKAAMASGKIKYGFVFRGVKGNPIVTLVVPDLPAPSAADFFDDKWNVDLQLRRGQGRGRLLRRHAQGARPARASPSSTPTRRARRSSAARRRRSSSTPATPSSRTTRPSRRRSASSTSASCRSRPRRSPRSASSSTASRASAPNKDNAITFMKWFAQQRHADRAGPLGRPAGASTPAVQRRAGRQGPPPAADRAGAAQRGRPGAPAHAGLGEGRVDPRHRAEQGARPPARTAAPRSTAPRRR